MRVTNIAAGFAITSLCLATIGCDSKISERGARTSQASNQTTDALRITEIRIGKSNEATALPLTTADPIDVVFKTTGTATGAHLEAKLFNLSNGQLVATQTQKIVIDTPSSTTMIFKSSEGWLAGRYLLEVTVDGKLAEQRDIDVIEALPDTK